MEITYGTRWVFSMGLNRLMGIRSEVSSAIQSRIGEYYSGNSSSFNTNIINNYGVQVPPHVPGMQSFMVNLRLNIFLRIFV